MAQQKSQSRKSEGRKKGTEEYKNLVRFKTKDQIDYSSDSSEDILIVSEVESRDNWAEGSRKQCRKWKTKLFLKINAL